MALSLFSLAGCGSGNGQSNDCAPGYVLADPDGHGMRCVSAASECLAPGTCAAPTSVCCRAECSDPDADSRFTCNETCLVPDCAASSECAALERCEIYNECSASCVPDQPCEAGQVMADPDGTGFRCVPADSACFRPIDCPPSTNQCCETSCRAGADGRFACAEDCEDGTAGAAGASGGAQDEAVAPSYDCYHDEECASWGPGYTCQGCPGWCMPPDNSCTVDADCVVATDVRACCNCPTAMAARVADEMECVIGPEEIEPAGCRPECGDVYCAECPAIDAATCASGYCTGVVAL